MQYGLKLVTPPAVEPVSVAEARLHCYVDDPMQDNLLMGFITAARQHIETVCNRALITQTWELVLDAWPKADREIILPRSPLQRIESITYTDNTGADRELPTYLCDTSSEPGRVGPAFGLFWPGVPLQPMGAIKVRYVAGYGDAEQVPQSFKQAILLLVGQWFENRENVVVGSNTRELPFAVKSLIAPYVVR